MKLVDDWKKAWAWLSVQIAAIAGIAAELYESVPQFKAYFSDSTFHHFMAACAVCIIVGRVIRQRSNVAPTQ